MATLPVSEFKRCLWKRGLRKRGMDMNLQTATTTEERESLMSKVEARYQSQYTIYEFRLRIRDKMFGGVARDLDTQVAAVEASIRRKKIPEETGARILEDIRNRFLEQERKLSSQREEVGDAAEIEGEMGEDKAINKRWTSFWIDEVGLYYESRCLKSCLRECMSKLNHFMATSGSKGSHDYGVFISPFRLRFERDGEVLQAPDGFEDRPVICIVNSGGKFQKITSIKRQDYVGEGTEIAGTIKVLAQGKVTETMLIEAFSLAQDAGIGAGRSQGFGQFDLVQFDRIQKGEKSAVKSKAQQKAEKAAKK